MDEPVTPVPTQPIVPPTPVPNGFIRRNWKIFLFGFFVPAILEAAIFVPILNLFAIQVAGIVWFPIYIALSLRLYWLLWGSSFIVLPNVYGLIFIGIFDGLILVCLAEILYRWGKRTLITVIGVVILLYLGSAFRDLWIPVTIGRLIPSTCTVLRYESSRDSCFQNAAFTKNDFHICTRISYNPYPCIQHFVNTQTPDDACMMFPRGSNGGDNCTILLATTKSTPAICDQISGNAKNSCLQGAHHPASVTDCEALFSGASERVRCVWDIAQNTKNPTLCDYSQPGYDANTPQDQEFGHWLGVCLQYASDLNGNFGYSCEKTQLSPLNKFVCVLSYVRSIQTEDLCKRLTDPDQIHTCESYRTQ